MLYTFTAYRSDRSCVKPNSFVCAPRCTQGAFLPPSERGGLTRILIKVSRSDLLADLRAPGKRAAYVQIAGACVYVIRQGIAQPEEIPSDCGVMVASGDRLELVRPAPRQPTTPSFDLWMTLARATPEPGWPADEAQQALGTGEPESDPDGA